MDTMNYWTRISTYLLGILITQYAEARPTTAREPGLSREDVKSLVYHILESSKLSKDLATKDEGLSQDDDSNKRTITGAEKGAIVGGTVAAGIVLGVTVFVVVLIYKQYLIRRQQRGVYVNTATSPHQNGSKPETTAVSSTCGSWRHTFNHRMSVPDSASVYSQRSFGNDISTAQIGVATAQPMPPTTMPSKAAQMLGIEPLESTTPLTRTPLPSPRLPIKPFPQNSMPQGPLPQSRPPQCPLPSIPVPSGSEEDVLSRGPRDRTSSNCTMSTLGRELLHDVMQPLSLSQTKFSPPPDKTEFTRPPLPISKVKKPPPVAFNNNTKGQKRMPSRRYFVPLFKNNGQLLSPTSPEESSAPETAIEEETNAKAETVLRDSSRAGLFFMGENKI
ncbi:Ff.00g047500.m01.CDS01 [Fusarium sp. VM40]|nr:Ff.00g047500.m01.CDS01 [Fusarium sp. VM40]